MEDSESWEVQCECSGKSFSPWEAFPSLAAPLPALAQAEIPGRVCSLELVFALLCSAVTSRCLSKAARALQPSLTPSKSPECLPRGVPLVPAHPMEPGIPSLGQEAAPGPSPALGAHGAPAARRVWDTSLCFQEPRVHPTAPASTAGADCASKG